MAPPLAPTARALDAAARAAFSADGGRAGPRALPGVSPYPSAIAELGVIANALLVIGSVPALPAVLIWLLWRARKAEPERRRRAWAEFLAATAAVLALAWVPVRRRPGLMQARLWRWWLEYMSVRVAYRSGEALPERQYLFVMVPHGLYPFSGACAAISKMVHVFFGMRIAVASNALRVPIVRHLMGWIGCVGASQASIGRALQQGDSVCIFPGGIGEMVRTDSSSERLLLGARKGFARLALQHGVPVVPVYVFGQSVAFGQLPLPAWVERLSRWLRVSLILPFGRFGLLIPRKLPLLYTIGAPILAARSPDPTASEVDAVHGATVAAVRDMYHFYRGAYGWGDRPLHVE